ncbi:MAG: Holliday junction DNA helicase RuvA [Deltaproteobacteria bacterium]|nr:MAG: Holliday junction DNA helicase RuvA [Deltaproteobacteria bacterium]
MIAYLEGTILKKEPDRVVLLAGPVGYEVMLPAYVMASLHQSGIGDPLALHIYYYQTERQPRPVLIGFTLEAEKLFFQHFISVEAIGPMKAVKALEIPIRDVARAIESGDVPTLTRLSGIGTRTAQKIIATLQGKVSTFAMIRPEAHPVAPNAGDFVSAVMEVLVHQLGYKQVTAMEMVEAALKRNPAISGPEDLFDEVYRGEMP